MSYVQQIKAILSPTEHKVFAKLSSAQKIQDFLDALKINFEEGGEGLFSPRKVLEAKKAHCIEGALFATAVLAYHEHPPLLLDFQTLPSDEDHVVALFKQCGLWGAISKTNHAVLRWRDPIYRTVRELAMSYAHEYYLWSGKKSLMAYSKPFDLRKYKPQEWVTTEKDLWNIASDLDDSSHFPIATKEVLQNLRRASAIELKTLKVVEWKKK